jgi:AcrR family transcriptional regulator
VSSVHADRRDVRRPSQRARQKAETRRRLLDAATEVFIESGPTTASLDRVAARAGVSKPTLFFHFGSRTELMDALVQYHLTSFRSEAREYQCVDLRSFLEAYLRAQRRRTVRLVWHLGDLLYPDHPDGPNAGYRDLIDEIERRLVDAGLAGSLAHERAVVLAPALMMVARRAAQDLATEDEMRSFVSAACRLALQRPSSLENAPTAAPAQHEGA